MHLRLLQFTQKLVLKTLELHALLLVFTDLICHLCRHSVDLVSGNISLLLNEFVLLSQTVCLLLPDLLLAVLSLIVALLTHSVEVVLHLLFLSTNLFDRGHLLIPEIFVAEVKLLLFSFPAPAGRFTISLILRLTSLLFTTALHHLVIVLALQVLKLSRLLAGLLDFLDSPDLLILKHTDSVAQLLNVPLQLEAD